MDTKIRQISQRTEAFLSNLCYYQCFLAHSDDKISLKGLSVLRKVAIFASASSSIYLEGVKFILDAAMS